jgi:hypothetical protein
MCNCNNTPLCSNNDCSCPVKDLSTDCVLYTGEDLACSGIKSQTILTDLIQQLDDFICNIETQQPTLNIVNVGTGAGVYKGIVGSNRQLRSIKSPDGSVGVAVSPNGNEIHLTANSAELIDKISLSFDWKNNGFIAYRTTEDLPRLVTNTEYLRKGFIGFYKPILVGTVVEHPLIQIGVDFYSPILIEAIVQNLGVKIKNFDKIADLSPVLVISKYTNTEPRKDKNPQPIPDSTTGEVFPNTVYRKGSFKFSEDNDPVRLTRVPIQAQYQVIDFGQEHYFKTSKKLQTTGALASDPDFRVCDPPIRTRACAARYSTIGDIGGVIGEGSSSTSKVGKSTSFVYLQFHIEITVDGEKIISKPLGKLKMILTMAIDLSQNPESPGFEPIPLGTTIPYDYLINEPHKPKTTIRYKHT